MQLSIEYLIPIGSFATALVGVIVAFQTKNKVKNEASQVLSDTALSLVKPLKEEMNELRKELGIYKLKFKELEHEVEILQGENRELRAGIDLLTRQVIALGQNPIYKPPKKKDKDKKKKER